MGRCPVELHPAQRKRNEARPNPGETQRQLGTTLAPRAQRRQSPSRQAGFLRLWLVLRSLQWPPAHVAYGKHNGLPHGDRPLSQRSSHRHYPVQSHGPRSRKTVAASGGRALFRQPLKALSTDSFFSSRQSRKLAEAFHFAARHHSAVLLHHCAHLKVLLENRIDVLHSGAAAFRDALAALAVNDVVIAPLFVG